MSSRTLTAKERNACKRGGVHIRTFAKFPQSGRRGLEIDNSNPLSIPRAGGVLLAIPHDGALGVEERFFGTGRVFSFRIDALVLVERKREDSLAACSRCALDKHGLLKCVDCVAVKRTTRPAFRDRNIGGVAGTIQVKTQPNPSLNAVELRPRRVFGKRCMKVSFLHCFSESIVGAPSLRIIAKLRAVSVGRLLCPIALRCSAALRYNSMAFFSSCARPPRPLWYIAPSLSSAIAFPFSAPYDTTQLPYVVLR